MKRREFCIGGVSAAMITTTGCSAVGGDPLVDTARMNSHIDRLVWNTSGKLQIFFKSGSDSDAWTLHHADVNPTVQDTLTHGAPPRFEGPIAIDFQKVVNQAGYEFPSRQFQLVFWDADTSDGAGMFTGEAFTVISDYSFMVPEESNISI